MYTLSIFLILCILQLIFIWVKWSEIKEYSDLVGETVESTGISKNKTYKKAVMISGHLLRNFKKLLWIPTILIMFANIIAALVVGTLLSIIF